MLGQAILRRLAGRENTSVLALYRQSEPAPMAANIATATCNLLSMEPITSLLKRFAPTVFIHTAATGMQLPRPSSETVTEVNVEMPVRLAKAVGHLDGCTFVHVSSGLAYKDQGRPLREDDPLETEHSYGASKAQSEERLRSLADQSDLHLLIVRPFSFTGPGDSGTRLFPSLLENVARERRFDMSAGDQVRDHASVDDIATGVVAAALRSEASREQTIFNLGTGDTRTLRELVTSVIDQLGLNIDIKFGARAQAAGEPMFVVPDMTHTRKVLHWQARENIAHAVWRLARQSFPSLRIREPKRTHE